MLGFAVEGNAPPPKKITSWFLSKGQGKTRDDSADYIPHDIYVIGTQEDPLGEKEWLEILKHSLQEITSMTFKTVSSGHIPGWDSGAVGWANPGASQKQECAQWAPPLPGPERGTCIQKLMGSVSIAHHWGPPSSLPELVGHLYFIEISSVPALISKTLCLICEASLGVPQSVGTTDRAPHTWGEGWV